MADDKQSAGLFSRVVTGFRYAATGRAPDGWFGPGQTPALQASPVPTGRQFDFPVGWNLRTQPRQDEAISFGQLRDLADGWDLLRLVIETRKDQIAALSWSVMPRLGATASDDGRLERLTGFLRYPDDEHGWAQWMRILLEDLFVLDAPTLYLRRDRVGRLIGLDIIDGATIKRVLSSDGRTPPPPDPAYQQIFKGVPAVDYTADELLYSPRNPRAHKVYGFSPVEQIVMTINIALRRQASQLAYFTEGNTPEALIGVPDAWSPEQIRQFQEYWDALLEGNLAARRHTRFVPGGLSYQPTRDVPLKDDFDDWLARVVCFAFSIPPTALVRQLNRATAETAKDSALTEGLAPLMQWLKDLIDRVITRVLGWDDLEFVWNDAGSIDPAVQAQIDVAYVGAGIKTRDEVRAELGLGTAVNKSGTLKQPPSSFEKAGYSPDENRDDRGKWTDGNSEPANASTPKVTTVGDESKSIVQQNRDRHERAVEAEIAKYEAAGFKVTPRVRFSVPELGITTEVDFVVSTPGFPSPNPFLAIDVKTGNGDLTDNQRAAYPRLTDGVVAKPLGLRALEAGFIPYFPVFIKIQVDITRKRSRSQKFLENNGFKIIYSEIECQEL